MIKDRFKGWPEQKKKNFAIIVAGIITIGIVIVWFSFNPLLGKVDFGNKTQIVNTDYINDSLNKINEQYNLVVDQISNLTSSTSELFGTNNSTSSVEFSKSTQ